MRMQHRARRLLTLIMIPALGACYTYTVMPVEQIPVGSSVRARISGAEADRLTELLGEEQDRVVDGELAEKRPDNVLLSVPNSLRPTASSGANVYRMVVIPRTSLFDVEVKRLNRWKTGGIAAIAAAVVGYIAVSQFGSNGSEGGPGKGGTDK